MSQRRTRKWKQVPKEELFITEDLGRTRLTSRRSRANLIDQKQRRNGPGYEKQPTLVDCQAQCHSVSLQGLSLGLGKVLCSINWSFLFPASMLYPFYFSSQSHKMSRIVDTRLIQYVQMCLKPTSVNYRILQPLTVEKQVHVTLFKFDLSREHFDRVSLIALKFVWQCDVTFASVRGQCDIMGFEDMLSYGDTLNLGDSMVVI